MLYPFYGTLLYIFSRRGNISIIAFNNTNVDFAVTFRWEDYIITDLHFVNETKQHTRTGWNGTLFSGRLGCNVVRFESLARCLDF